ncbi:MAG: SMC family ATPase [Chloroflexi bacterium]|nr:SMC family ATPase [Chloroflexota bacterium]
MLPIQLEIKNFLPYRNPDPLLFEGIHLACLSGPNGAGKSSILDAMTWAIWGKARARSDDDLIHIGQDEMMVRLDFLQDGTRYRVQRYRKRGRVRSDGRRSVGNSELHLLAYDPGRNIYNTITEGTIRETQDRIIELLSLDYDTFVNSAFLQQGQADAFTIKTPGQRKQILADILGLDRWAEYEETVKEELRKIENELQGIRLTIEQNEQEIAQEPTLQQNLTVAREDLYQAQEALDVAQENYDELAGVDKELKALENDHKRITATIAQHKKNIADAAIAIERHQKEVEQYQLVVENKETIEEGYQQLKEAQEANQAIADALQELRKVEKRIQDIQGEITREQQKLELEVSKVSTLIEESSAKAQNADELAARYDELELKIKDLEDLEAERDEQQANIGEMREKVAGLDAENRALKDEMNKIRERLDRVEAVETAECPLCGQPLTAEHRADLIKDLEEQGYSRGDRYRSNGSTIEQVRDDIKEAEEAVKAYNEQLAGLSRLRGEMGSLQQQLADAEEAVKRLDDYQTHLNDLTKTLTERTFAEELTRQLKAAQEDHARIAYNEDEHEAVREALATYGDFQNRANELQVALNALPTAQQNLQDARERCERWQELLTQNEAEQEALVQKMEELKLAVVELERREKELRDKRTHQRSMAEKVIKIEQSLSAIESMRFRNEELGRREQALLDEKGINEQLKHAFGRNGVPAMIIDAAIPELEETANNLLRRMTSGRMNVRFDTQREKKTGGVAETFDIWISDELGTRDYSLYSGGEAFRVNFAIRVAISQLLARRAGAQLRTLFIDEGFGTQDEEGRQRLSEAIIAVQDEFDLVLVITHLDELRDSFPVRIEVEKHDTGSYIMLR